MLKRNLEKQLKSTFLQYPVVTLIGPRQSGKSTLVRSCFPELAYVNLENPEIRRFVTEDPQAFLNEHSSGAILDEIQNTPELLSFIQVLVDEKNQNSLFVLTGSHQLALHESISQSLAGRTALLTLLPLSIAELKSNGIEFAADKQMLQGGYPRIYHQNLDPTRAYADYYQTYIQRDVRQMINIKDLNLFTKFIKLCAGRVGSLLSASSLANEVGVSSHTINSWLSILEASFIIFRLQPYFENFGKRAIKSSKLYFTDIGLACYLLDIENITQIKRDPLRGALFENMVVLELMKFRLNQGKNPNLYFYRDNHKNEVDVIFKYGYKLLPIEIKSAQTFNSSFLKNLKFYHKIAKDYIDESYLIYAGNQQQKIDKTQIINFQNMSIIWQKLDEDKM